MCVQELQAHLNVYFSDGQMLAAMAQICNIYIHDIGLSHKILF